MTYIYIVISIPHYFQKKRRTCCIHLVILCSTNQYKTSSFRDLDLKKNLIQPLHPSKLGGGFKYEPWWWFWGTGWLLDVIGGVPLLGGGFKYCLFSPRTLRKWWNLTNIFFRWRWKHQLENDHRLDVNISKDWRFSTQCVLIGAWSTGEKDQRSLLATSCHGTHGNVIRDYFKRCGGCQKCW